MNDTHQEPAESEIIFISIVKAGGERTEGKPQTDINGCTSAHATFNLYKEQPIVATAYPTYHPDLIQKKTLPWEVVQSNSVNKAYTWDVYFAFVL